MLRISCNEIGENPEIGKEYSTIRTNLFGLHSSGASVSLVPQV
jgi:hypothetical protein